MNIFAIHSQSLKVWWAIYVPYVVLSLIANSLIEIGYIAECIEVAFRLLILSAGVYLITKNSFTVRAAVGFGLLVWLFWTTFLKIIAECVLVALGQAQAGVLLDNIVGICALQLLSTPIYVGVPIAVNLVLQKLPKKWTALIP